MPSISIFRKSKDAPKYEIIVTDDSRSDRCRKVVELEFPNASWKAGKMKGPAGNRNAGAARAMGEWIIFIDDDCIAQTSYISSYYKAINQNPSIGVLEEEFFQIGKGRHGQRHALPMRQEDCFGPATFVSKNIFDELGGLDEQFEVAYEDVDLPEIAGWRHPLSFVYEAAVCHPWRSVREGGLNNWKAKDYEAADFARFFEKT